MIAAVPGGGRRGGNIYIQGSGCGSTENACRALVSCCQNFKCSRQGRRRPPAASDQPRKSRVDRGGGGENHDTIFFIFIQNWYSLNPQASYGMADSRTKNHPIYRSRWSWRGEKKTCRPGPLRKSPRSLTARCGIVCQSYQLPSLNGELRDAIPPTIVGGVRTQRIVCTYTHAARYQLRLSPSLNLIRTVQCSTHLKHRISASGTRVSRKGKGDAKPRESYHICGSSKNAGRLAI